MKPARWLSVLIVAGGPCTVFAQVPDVVASRPGPTLAARTGTSIVTSTTSPCIVVDGVVDAAYGAALAADSAGDGNGNANMDLLELYAAQDVDSIYVAFTVNADLAAANGGKYVVLIDTTNDANGATSDAWSRNVVVHDPHKPEYGIYTWVDSAPYDAADTQLVHWTGSAWDWGSVTSVAAAAMVAGTPSVIEWRVAKADLGDPDGVWIEVWDTGGGAGDNAQDTINNPPEDWNATDWSSQAALEVSTAFGFSALPVITSSDAATFRIGAARSFAVTATGAPVPALSARGRLPAGLAFVDHGDGTAALSGTPAAGTGGVYPLAITAGNGLCPDATQSFLLTVMPTARTKTTLVSSKNPAPAPTKVRFTARVGFFTKVFGTPTGTIEFWVDGSPLGGPVRMISAQASSPLVSLPAGTHTVIAKYSGDRNFLPSSATLTQVWTEDSL